MTMIIRIVTCAFLLIFVGTDNQSYKNKNSGSIKQFTHSISLESNSLYFILRGSQTKLGGFAKEYNQSNKNATHVALGVYTDSLRIFHVNTGANKNNSLISENMESFITSEDDHYDYLAIWKINNIKTEEVQLVMKNIEALNNRKISFDYKFDIETDAELYCSEFIYKVIKPISSEKFSIPMYTKEVPKKHRFFLKKDTLTYYPTDFFLKYQNITLVDEWKLNNENLVK